MVILVHDYVIGQMACPVIIIIILDCEKIEEFIKDQAS